MKPVEVFYVSTHTQIYERLEIRAMYVGMRACMWCRQSVADIVSRAGRLRVYLKKSHVISGVHVIILNVCEIFFQHFTFACNL